ncbi:hypothetical protein LV779_14120 [Streptomyces thinghirensis]|nr:hypothetical protein [Streptomyces thinghirensis]
MAVTRWPQRGHGHHAQRGHRQHPQGRAAPPGQRRAGERGQRDAGPQRRRPRHHPVGEDAAGAAAPGHRHRGRVGPRAGLRTGCPTW